MDFRKILEKNKTKTKLVILTYLLIMCFVGLLVDIILFNPDPYSLINSILLLVTFEVMPYITIGILLITIMGVYLITKFSKKIILYGREYKKLDETTEKNSIEQQILNMVEEMAISANLGFIPETYIMYDTNPNAFAAGWDKNNAIVCVTTGLLELLNRNEVQAVIAHEIGHILNGDSRLTLYVGVLSNVILTVVNIFSMFLGSENSEAQNKARIILIILNIILPLVTSVLYFYLSRTREYMADAIAVRLTGDNQAMISALEKISGNFQRKEKNESTEIGDKYRSAAYIFQTGDSLFSTHPSIENRIKNLQNNK